MTIKQIKTVNVTATTASKILTIFVNDGYDKAVASLAFMIIKAGQVDTAIAADQAAQLVKQIIAKRIA